MTTTTGLELTIRAYGHVAQKGSKEFKGMRAGRPILVDADKRLPEWTAAVIAAAHNAMRAHGSWLPLDRECEVSIVFLLEKPKTVTRPYPTSKQDGDMDKQTRATLDALESAGVYTNDGRVVRYFEPFGQVWASGGQRPGARIVVRSLADQLAVI